MFLRVFYSLPIPVSAYFLLLEQLPKGSAEGGKGDSGQKLNACVAKQGYRGMDEPTGSNKVWAFFFLFLLNSRCKHLLTSLNILQRHF